MIDKDVLLKLVTEDVVINIMQENGSPLYNTSVDGQTKQRCLWFRTICHGGDSHKLCFFTESKDFYCYTNCGRMNFFEFIKRIRDAKNEEFYTKVICYVAQKVGKTISRNRHGFTSEVSGAIREEVSEMDRQSEDIKRRALFGDARIKTNYNDKKSILKYFDNNTFYKGWIDEGISIETMQKFGIEWYNYQKYIIIPHYDIDGNLVGIRRRSLKPEDVNNKYMPLFIAGEEFGHSLGLNLYGLYENKDAIKRLKKAIIVEGEKSVLKSDSYFGNKSCTVATCGFNISDWQIRALEKLGVEKVYLGFDKDFDERYEDTYKQDKLLYENYKRYLERLRILSQRLASSFSVFLIKDSNNLLKLKDSPFDEGKEKCKILLKEALPVYTCDSNKICRMLR